jgi:hypothetical protein
MPIVRTSLPLVVALALGAAGCAKTAGESPASGAAATATATATIAAPSAAAGGGARAVEQSDALIDFAYSYPAAAGAIPDLKRALDVELARARADLIAKARAQRAEAKHDGYPFNPFGSWTGWKVVTELPGWLSLSADIGSYEGGAHPNHGFTALVWDKQANQRRDPLDLFVSKAALSGAIRKDFCAALNRERGKRRGEPVRPGSTDQFDECIEPADSTVILGSSNRRTFDRVGVLVGPYAAGPYVEGDYEVTLPVTPAVLAAVKPEYRAAFTTGR